MPRGPKFIIVDVNDIELHTTHPHGIWLTDYLWYNAHNVELETWMEANDVQMQGMIIKFRTEQERTLFLLKWQ